MSKQTINVGSSANDGTGDKNRVAFQKINENFTELYDAIPTAQQYKFLLSQSGGDDPQTATSGTLTQGVTYEIVAFETGDDFIPSGAPNNTVGTKWIANGVAPTWGNGSELGWNGGVPIPKKLVNTLNQNIWWEKDIVIPTGLYSINFSEDVDFDKLFFPEGVISSNDNWRFAISKINPRKIEILALDSADNPQDDYFSNTPMYFEIYP